MPEAFIEKKLWFDDIRRPPDNTWIWARTYQGAVDMFEKYGSYIMECSLDHDLGLHDMDPDIPDADMQRGFDPDHDGVKLIKWMIETDHIPDHITIHSWNPVGATNMSNALKDAGYNCIVRPYVRPV